MKLTHNVNFGSKEHKVEAKEDRLQLNLQTNERDIYEHKGRPRRLPRRLSKKLVVHARTLRDSSWGVFINDSNGEKYWIPRPTKRVIRRYPG